MSFLKSIHIFLEGFPFLQMPKFGQLEIKCLNIAFWFLLGHDHIIYPRVSFFIISLFNCKCSQQSTSDYLKQQTFSKAVEGEFYRTLGHREVFVFTKLFTSRCPKVLKHFLRLECNQDLRLCLNQTFYRFLNLSIPTFYVNH